MQNIYIADLRRQSLFDRSIIVEITGVRSCQILDIWQYKDHHDLALSFLSGWCSLIGYLNVYSGSFLIEGKLGKMWHTVLGQSCMWNDAIANPFSDAGGTRTAPSGVTLRWTDWQTLGRVLLFMFWKFVRSELVLCVCLLGRLAALITLILDF